MSIRFFHSCRRASEARPAHSGDAWYIRTDDYGERIGDYEGIGISGYQGDLWIPYITHLPFDHIWLTGKKCV